MWWQYVIIFVVLLIISFVVIKLKQKDFSININKLIQYLGGKDNIIEAEVNMSRLKVTLKDMTIVDKDGIQKLGARGIVEIDDQLKIICGPDSQKLKKYFDDLK